MRKILCQFACVLILVFACGSQRTLLYQRTLPQSIKRIAVLSPDKSIISGEFSAEFLQKMLAYMVFQETTYFVQPIDSTNLLMDQVDFANNSYIQISTQLKVDGILRYDFVDLLKTEKKREGFIISVSLIDCKQGKIVWRTLHQYKGKAETQKYQALKQYFQNKLNDTAEITYFAEIYSILKEAFKACPAPDYTENELTKRLLDTTEPF